MSSIIPITISALQQIYNPSTDAYVDAEALENLLLFFLVVNSIYCFSWDILMDWGMGVNSEWVCYHDLGSGGGSKGEEEGGGVEGVGVGRQFNKRSILRPVLLFGNFWSITAIVLNFILRFSWLLRFYENDLSFTKDQYVLLLQFLEVFRRGVWNIFRLEWELIKVTRDQLKKGREAENDVGTVKRMDLGNIEMM